MPEDFVQIAAHFFNSFTAGGKTEFENFFADCKFLLRGDIEKNVYDILENFAPDKKPKHTPSFGAKLIADDKKLMYQYFERHNFPFAKSIFFNFSSIKKAENNADNAQNVLNIAVTGSAPNAANAAQTEELFSRIAQKLNTPFVAKPRFGSQGRGIQLIETNKDFAAFIAQNQSEELIFQQYIKCGKGFSFDLRFFVCGGKVSACALRKSRHQLLSNFHAGGQMEIIKSAQDLQNHDIFGVTSRAFARMQQTAVSAVQNAGLLYGSADFLILQDSQPAQFFLCEINASPGFEGIENASSEKIQIVPQLIDAVIRL